MKFRKRAKALNRKDRKGYAKDAKQELDRLAFFAIKSFSPQSTPADHFGGSGSSLSRIPTVSSTVLPTISRLLGLSLSAVSCTVCQNTSL
jgi:hypothetical protein